MSLFSERYGYASDESGIRHGSMDFSVAGSEDTRYMFLHLNLSALEQQKKKVGRAGYPATAMLCAFIVVKCESFGYITDLADYLENNRLIAYYCGFDITKPLPSYWT